MNTLYMYFSDDFGRSEIIEKYIFHSLRQNFRGLIRHNSGGQEFRFVLQDLCYRATDYLSPTPGLVTTVVESEWREETSGEEFGSPTQGMNNYFLDALWQVSYRLLFKL